MKIAIFTDIYTPSGSGGIVSSIRAQKSELIKMGHEVTVFCPGHHTNEKGVFLVPTHQKAEVNGSKLAYRPEIIMQAILDNYPGFQDFDVIHVHYEASCSLAGILLAKKFNIPLVQTMHGREDMAIAMNVPAIFRRPIAWGLNKLHAKYVPHGEKIKKDKFQAPTRARALMWEMMVSHAEQADVVVTPANPLAKKLEHYGVTRPIEVVPNGVLEEMVSGEFKERSLEDGGVLKMVWSSRLSNEKRVLPFLQAVAQMKRPYMLYMYGDGNAEKKAQKFANKHQLKVKFFGAQPREKIIARMKEAHLAVLTSYNFDTQGMVLIEAEATGLPVFFCDPELMEVVPSGGFVISGGAEPTAMAIELDKMDSAEIAKMSKVMLKNRKQVLAEMQAKRLIKVYERAQKEKAAD